MVMGQGDTDRTKQYARAKGWHLYDGETLLGKRATVVLCKRCVDGRRRDLPPAPPLLQGQLELELTDEGQASPASRDG